ncbi:MAG: hypothetical protein JSV99_00985 [Planctomycetota bacterium]|nr:MAG: hypothetical protein JSV99_00985 [Planctomycetota bacterium]
MSFLAQLIIWINILTNNLGRLLLAPVAVLPGWLSNTIISAVTGVALLVIFKYTSNQRAIGRVRDNIKAHMLALKLFKDSMSVTLQAQGQVFKGALLLLLHAVRPMAVMIVPVALLLSQMGLWYQSRPLMVGEDSVVAMKLNGSIEQPWPNVNIESMPAAEVTMGPVRVLSKREVYWKIKARENGYHHIMFQVAEEQVEKELVIGKGFMRVSAKQPGWQWTDILLYPWEKPFGPDSVVESISIDYPDRLSWASGTDWWLVYFFVASLIFALIFKPLLKVRI